MSGTAWKKLSDEDIKRMSELLKSGATMLADTCPVCGSPLFRLRDGSVICPHCQKKVVYLKEGENEDRALEPYVLEEVRSSLFSLLRKLAPVMASADPDEALPLVQLANSLLEALKSLSELQRRIAEGRRGELAGFRRPRVGRARGVELRPPR